jgi:hypothetical protein
MSLSLIFWILYNIIVSRGFLKAMEIEDYEFYAGQNARANSIMISENQYF